jgi:hypothetical protein
MSKSNQPDHDTETHPTKKKSAKQTKPAPIDPANVPWFDESYSFADRDRELTLTEHLLSMQLVSVRRERAFLRQQIASGSYGLPFHDSKATDTDTGTGTETETESR